MALPAVDISKYQGVWHDYPADIIMVKVSGGDRGLYIDPQAARNYSGVIAAGKGFGGYHFAGGTDPIAEANYYLNAMKPWNPGEVPVLDWEVSNPDPVGWCLSFATHVHDMAGAWPLIYMNLATLRAHNWTPVLNNCGLWLADWTNNPDSVINVGYHGYVMLQYNDGPNYDHDEWEYDLETFKKYGWPDTTPQPAPTPAPTPSPAPEPAPLPTPEPAPQPIPPAQEPSQTVPGETTPPQTVQQTQQGEKMNFVKKLWAKVPKTLKPALHTLWQSGVSTLGVQLATAHSTADVKGGLIVVGSVALAGAKALLLKYLSQKV